MTPPSHQVARAGMTLLGQRRYGMVLSDMGRVENGADVPDAGLRLLAEVRDVDVDVPVVIFASFGAVERYRDAALAQGATAVTASPATVVTYLMDRELL